ncbi:MAG TPA: hypothetical protein DCM08_11815 [Microscillaceae bacterium]|nr:hypothetical protein [Microscillaceae bacterium]
MASGKTPNTAEKRDKFHGDVGRVFLRGILMPNCLFVRTQTRVEIHHLTHRRYQPIRFGGDTDNLQIAYPLSSPFACWPIVLSANKIANYTTLCKDFCERIIWTRESMV